MYARQAPSSEKKYYNLANIFMKKQAFNIKLIQPNSPFLIEISCNI